MNRKKKIIGRIGTACAGAAMTAAFGAGAWAQESAAASEYSWEGLGTMAGATAATLMIVQLIKAPLDKVWHIPTRLLVYAVALAILLTAQFFSGGLNVERCMLAAVNAVMAALSAYGSYEVIFQREKKT